MCELFPLFFGVFRFKGHAHVRVRVRVRVGVHRRFHFVLNEKQLVSSTAKIKKLFELKGTLDN